MSEERKEEEMKGEEKVRKKGGRKGGKASVWTSVLGVGKKGRKKV